MAAFGVSSYLFREARLDREHLVHIAAHGFEVLEVFAAPGHFDIRDGPAVAALAEWLADTRLALHALHLPGNGHGETPAADEALAALEIAGALPYRYLVVHPPTDGRGADRRSLEAVAGRAREAGVQVAIALTPDTLPAPALADLVDEGLEGLDVGVCLDYGHAHLMGDLPDAIEALSGHVVTTHVHDNRGRRDEHLVPFAGTIDWDAAVMATQKVGYDGVFVFEVAADGDTVDTLRRCESARARLEQRFITF